MIHGPEHDRDVPASCTCEWEWVPAIRRWIRTDRNPDCIWHGAGVEEL